MASAAPTRQPAAEEQPQREEGPKAGLQTLQVKIGGMSCSFCVSTIEKAVGRLPGVKEVGVSLAHEETLVRYDPRQLEPDRIRDTIRDIGYTVRDPRKVQAFEEQEAELKDGLPRLLLAGGFTLGGLFVMSVGWLGGQGMPRFPVPVLLLALATMFGPGWEIKTKAWASIKRGILNQHVLLEFAAFGGLAGGIIGFFDATRQSRTSHWPSPSTAWACRWRPSACWRLCGPWWPCWPA